MNLELDTNIIFQFVSPTEMLDNGFKVHIEDMFYNYINFTLMTVSKIGHPFRTMKEMHTLTLQALIHACFASSACCWPQLWNMLKQFFLLCHFKCFKKKIAFRFSLSYLLISWIMQGIIFCLSMSRKAHFGNWGQCGYCQGGFKTFDNCPRDPTWNILCPYCSFDLEMI